MKAKQILLTLLCLGVLSTVTGCYIDPGPPPYGERSAYGRQRREERARERAEDEGYREREHEYRHGWQYY